MGKRPTCVHCSAKATKLCDGLVKFDAATLGVERGSCLYRSCDAPLCGEHAVKAGTRHHKVGRRFVECFGPTWDTIDYCRSCADGINEYEPGERTWLDERRLAGKLRDPFEGIEP